MSKHPWLRTLQPRIPLITSSRVKPAPRPSRAKGGQGLYTYRWKQARIAFLRQHPLCQCPDCDEGRKRVTIATVVDHSEPHRGDERIFWDVSKWVAMSKPCHDAKTAREDGGFGNPGKT
jgi:5-methylcytosine-specific restriction protein A